MLKVENYICSLLSKPFVILSGASGTGKTRLAIQFAEAINLETQRTSLTILKVDKKGCIKNKTEDQIKDLCSKLNTFDAMIHGDSSELVFNIKITMCSYIESNDEQLNHIIRQNDETVIEVFQASKNINLSNNYQLVPVGADWADVRYLLGYVNPFGQDGKKTYEVPDTLKVILRALHPTNRNKPYFLILDEMNLSHVERYFSTFLSVMEANKSTKDSIILIQKEDLGLIKEALHNKNLTEELEATESLLNDNLGVYLPENLFIVGTINVDETTYMFSPKVLDRAHVMELNTQNPQDYFEKLKLEEGLSRIHFEENEVRRIVQLFEVAISNRKSNKNNALCLIKEKDIDIEKRDKIIDDIQMVMVGLYRLLEPCGFDYGYRTVNEILEYIGYSLHVKSENEWIEILDLAILQKVLPKIHGNKRQLGDSLKAILDFLNGDKAIYMHGTQEIVVEATSIKLKQSRVKIEKMFQTLNYLGYTSFIS